MSAVERLIDLLKRVGGVALVAMMLVTCVDVIFRYFGHPIFGAVEVVSFLATIVLACAMPQTHLERGHVGVDLVVRRLSPRSQALIDAATNLVSAILFALVSWQMFLYGAALAKSGEVSMSLEFPTYILVYLVAVAFGVLSLVIASDFLRHLRKVVQS
jgi:TRAP-type C4-dicarboxylate transport system permease small subunit